MPKLILFNLQHQLVQCSTVECQKNKKIVVYQLMIPFTMTRSSSRARQLLSRVNLTGFTVPTSGKIENICLFRKQLENILNNWLCPNFSCCPKILGCPKFWGGCSPPRPPGPYAYAYIKKEECTALHDILVFSVALPFMSHLHFPRINIAQIHLR